MDGYLAPIAIGTAFTTQIDIFELLAGTNMPIALLGFELGQATEIGDAQEEMLTLILKRVTGAPTSGSGGATPTPQPVSARGAGVASGTVLETGNTTPLSGGTSVELARFTWNVRQPLLWIPTPEYTPQADVATRFVLSLATAPTDSIGGINGWLSFAELL